MNTTSQNRPGRGHNAFTSGYQSIGGVMTANANVMRLRVIISMFGLGLSDVAKAGCVSRPYVSRVLSGGLQASPRFLRHLESNLGNLVEKRGGQVFSIAVTPVNEAENGMS